MISNFRIFTAILSGYVGLGLCYNMIIHYIVGHFDLRTVLKIVIERPLYIKVLNTIFYPINKVMNYFRIKSIIEEEPAEDLNNIFEEEDIEDSEDIIEEEEVDNLDDLVKKMAEDLRSIFSEENNYEE